MIFNYYLGYFARGMYNYKYSNEDFILKRKYFLTKECFELKKLKSENNNFIYVNTELPCLIYINKEIPVLSNFNIKECSQIRNIKSLNNLYGFIFREKLIIGNLNNSQSQNIVTKNINKQIYNFLELNKINAIAYIEEEIEDELSLLNQNQNSSSKCALTLVDKNLNELIKYDLERKNEVCYSFTEINLQKSDLYYSDKSVYFALGTAILEENFKEPELGYIIILELNDKFIFRKICEIETRGGVYKIDSIRNIIYVSIASCFYIYKLISNQLGTTKKSSNKFEVDDMGYYIDNRNDIINKNNNYWSLKLMKKSNEFNFIYDFICHEEYILISDMYRSVTLFKYNEEKDKFQELTRDFNPIWCNSILHVDKSTYMVSDINNNIYNLKFELCPKSDEERYKYIFIIFKLIFIMKKILFNKIFRFQRLSQFNFGEKILKMINIKKYFRDKDPIENDNSHDKNNLMEIEKNNAYIKNYENQNFNNFDNTNNLEVENFEKIYEKNTISKGSCLNLNYFSTSEGTIAVVINISKEVFDYLYFLQKEILKVIISPCNFEYEKWRSVRVRYIFIY